MQPIPNVGYSRLAAHRMLLGDRVRTEALQHAIEAVVRPGQIVVDIGTGSGVLALFAARAGAQRVYAIEREQIVQVAKRVACSNGLDHLIEFIANDVATVDEIPQQADVLVSECIGSALVNTTMIERVLAARQRFLKPGGIMIPMLGELVACPVEIPVHDWYLRFWEQPQYGLDWRDFAPLASNQLYTAIINADDMLAEPQNVARLDFNSPETCSADIAGEATFSFTRDGIVHGIAIWFRLQLSPNIVSPQ